MLTQQNIFEYGFFKGETVEAVADNEPQYLEFLLKNNDLEPREYKIFQKALKEVEYQYPPKNVF